MVEIKGLEKFSSKDFPGHISSTVFLGGCTFRCPFCHNAELVLRPESFPTMPMDLFLGYLDGRKGWLEGVCVTGGEPLLSEDVEDLIRVIKERGLLVKLDTNGSLPGRLEKLVGDGVIDWIAMDVKAPLGRYSEVTGTAVKEEDIRRSVEIVKGSGLKYLFRTTVVPGLLGREDIRKISEWLEGADLYQLQQFVAHDTIDPAFLAVKPYPQAEFVMLEEIARPYFKEVRVEGA
jgi:pyruvate formate lyase activating enzyme